MTEMGVSFPASNVVADAELYNSSTDMLFGQDTVSGYYWGYSEHVSHNQWRYGRTGIQQEGFASCRYSNENNAKEGVLKYTFQVDDAETELKVVLGFGWFNGWGEIANVVKINGAEMETVAIGGGASIEKSYENIVGVLADDGKYYVTIQINEDSVMSAISYIMIQTENWVPGKNLTYVASNAFLEKGKVPTFVSSEGDVVEGELSAENQAKINATEYFSNAVVDVTIKGTSTVVKACSFVIIPAGCEYFVNCGDPGNGDILLSDAKYTEELGYGYVDNGNLSVGWNGLNYYESVRWSNTNTLEYKFDVENGTYVVYFGSICYWWSGTRSMKYSFEGGAEHPYEPTDAGTTFRDGARVEDGQLNLTFIKGNDTPLLSFILIAKAHEVSFDTDGGSSVASQYLITGEKIARPESPVKETVGATKYIFEKWVDAEGNDYDFSAPVTSNVALKAVYSEEKLSHTVSFCDDESFPIEGIDAQIVDDGGKVIRPADPVKEATAQYTYNFLGWFNGETAWDFENDVVTGNMFLVAQFEEVAILYTVNFVDETGASLADTQELAYGAKVTAPADPVKEATAEHTFAFAGWFNGETAWDFENGTIEGALTLTAQFTATVREYTLTILFADGSETQTVTYAYGEMASLEFAREGYTFVVTLNGEAITELQITSDAEITITYTAVEKPGESTDDQSSSSSSVVDSSSASSSDKPATSSCMSSIASTSMAFLAAIAIGIIIKKRK